LPAAPDGTRRRHAITTPLIAEELTMRILQPAGWPRPKGYANGIEATGRLVIVGGQIGWDETETFQSDDFVEQVRQTLKNTLAVLAEAGAGAEHVVRMTWYITDRTEYLARGREIGAVYRELMGKNFPAMAMVQVVALMEARARVEIETTAVVP
jgi:enamine deaminase RidA (YjgF/YER057c/UK114 family)